MKRIPSGDGAVIGTGLVASIDILFYEIWGENPACFQKRLTEE